MKSNIMQNLQHEIIEVGLADSRYPLFFGSGIRSELGALLESISFSRNVVVVSNELVYSLYGKDILQALELNGFSVNVVLIGDGEEHKNLTTLSTVYDKFVAADMDRSSGVIALGGGVVGDLAGYAASSYMRGVAYIQVPTTLLAQVDSSVGGKTAVNHPKGKNIIGAFYQPKLVCIDVAVLNTLEDRQFFAGFAEVIKYGVIYDSDFFQWLVNHVELLLKRDYAALKYAIMRSCQIKANIVGIDEKETGIRAILNFGHTFGHAIETLTGYNRFLHGEAVAIGMVVASKISELQGLCSSEEVDTITSLLTRFNLPIVAPDFPINSYVDSMMHDKKVKNGVLQMVLNRGIGQSEIVNIDNPLASLEPVFQPC
jgi:3-dehydroquinate synthase